MAKYTIFSNIISGSSAEITSVTGSLFGTASWANNAQTASYVITAQTASYVLNAVSTSYATNASTSSYVLQSVSASYATNASTSSYVITANTASYVLQAVSSSFATNAINATTASFITTAQTASYVLNAVSASYATTASYVETANTASYVETANTASYVLNAISASFATNAYTASFVTTAQTASYILQAVSASYAQTASYSLTLVAGIGQNAAGTIQLKNSAGTVIDSLTNVTSSYAATASSADNFLVRGTLTAQTIIAQTITSSIDYVTGSTRFGSLQSNTHIFTGSIYQSGSEAIFLGNVGIGTTNPAYKLDVFGTSGTIPLFIRTNNNTNNSAQNIIGFTTDNSTYSAKIQLIRGVGSYDLGLAFRVVNSSAVESEIMRLTSGGNVGIGTTSPAYKLDVSGSFRVDGTNGDFIVDSTGNDIYLTRNGASYFYAIQASSAISYVLGAGLSQSLYLNNNGNVGIGTTTPSAKLDVNGNTIITGSLTVITGSSIELQVTNTGVRIGNLITDTHTVTGSLNVSGSVTATNFTGSLFGTASWANNALTASFFGGSVTSASYALNATSASYALNATSASFASTSSYANATSTIGYTIGGSQIYYASVLSSTSPSAVNVFTNNTGSFTSAFYNYTLYSGSNARSGQISAVWVGGTVSYNDYSTTDIGNTLTVTGSVAIVTGQIQLNFQVPSSTAGWNIKATATYL